jgi:hypothetical protein
MSYRQLQPNHIDSFPFGRVNTESSPFGSFSSSESSDEDDLSLPDGSPPGSPPDSDDDMEFPPPLDVKNVHTRKSSEGNLME